MTRAKEIINNFNEENILVVSTLSGGSKDSFTEEDLEEFVAGGDNPKKN